MDNSQYHTDGPTPQERADGLNDLREWANETSGEEIAAEPIEKVWEDLKRLSQIAYKLGGYIINPPQGIAEAATKYYNDFAPLIRERLENGGARPDTVEAVLMDFGRALFGMNPPTASVGQMSDALNTISSLTAFYSDRYVLFMCVIHLYGVIIEFLTDYTARIKNEPDPQQRQQWFDHKKDTYVTIWAVAFQWLQQQGYVVVSDFAGVEQNAISDFLNKIERRAMVGNYLRYYAVAKYALRATAEQLAEINTPRDYDASRADAAVTELNKAYNKIVERLANVVNKSAAGETPPTEIVREAREVKDTIERVQYSENMALILSRGLSATADGERGEVLPISAFIEDYVKRHAVEVGVTPLILQKTIEGVNLLRQIKGVQPVNGIYTIATNISEFCECCGYKDANEEQKQQFSAALSVLHNLYIVIWKPKGRVLVQLFGVQQKGFDGGERGNLVLNVFANGLQGTGRPNFVSGHELTAMKKKEKGAAMLHFRGQILSKGHKVETSLLDEIFGYTDRLNEAERTGDPQQVAAVREYIRKHKSRDKKKLIQWFDDWAERGIISYEVTTTKNGETLYKWRRLMAPTDEEKELLKLKTKPDESA